MSAAPALNWAHWTRRRAVCSASASPSGCVSWRHIRAQGWHCEVVAPSSIARPSSDRVKTDRRDGLQLARQARSGEPAVVSVPAEVDEAVHDLVCARGNTLREQRNGHYRLKALLLQAACGLAA